MITVTLNEAEFQGQMNAIISQAKRPLAILKVAGRAVANLLRKWFLKKDRENINKLAPDRRQHFWQQVAHAVQNPVTDEAGNKVYISINHPAIAQKVFGGRITAKRVQNLAIPEEEQACGRSPSVFERETGLKLILIKSSDHAVLTTRIDPDSKTLQVEYLLTPFVDQAPDPTALPTKDEMQREAVTAGQSALDRQLKEEKP